MTLASFGTKILSFLMVPLYTNILSTEAYGTYDIYQTTLFLIVPVLSLNIADGIMRFSLDETYDKREVFMVGVRRYIVACVLCILLVGVNQCFSIIKTLTLYPQFFVLYFVTSLMSDVLNNYARGIEKVSDVAVGGIIGSVSMLRDALSYVLLYLQATLLVFYSYNWSGYLIQIGFVVAVFVLYFKELTGVARKVLSRVKSR